MRRESMFVDIHVLQTVPPSCINRDDTGSPKTAIYGGATRARVSSQSWKHAVREYFRETFPSDQSGYRTKKILDLLEKEIEKASQTQIKDFDKSKELVGKYLSTDYSSSTIDNYRRKLKKI